MFSTSLKVLPIAAMLFSLVFQKALLATPITIDYASGNGLNAQAVFDLTNAGNTLSITLTQNSVSPFGNVNGSANMVLSSINFNLGTTQITGGSVALNSGSNVVNSNGANWGIVATPNLQAEYGYSNTGIGNTGGASIPTALHAVTSHSNGGGAVTTFGGVVGGVGGGLDYGIVAAGSSPFGNSNFILDSVVINLSLSAPLANLDFLANGSYVEFGSDHLYVVPEPVLLNFIAVIACVLWRRSAMRGVRSRCLAA